MDHNVTASLEDGFQLSENQQQFIVTTEASLSGTEGEENQNHMEAIAAHEIGPLREQDRFLPIANVVRIMKTVIPKSGKIAKDARECVQECVSEFVSFITSEASDRCHQEKRKTINGEDILFAMQALGFDNYVEPLKLYLQKYRENGVKAGEQQSTSGAGAANAPTKEEFPAGATAQQASGVVGAAEAGIEDIGADQFIAGNILEAEGSSNTIYTAGFGGF